MVLGEKIALLRKQKGWSQEDLAERLDISRQSVSKWESGTSVPDLDKIIKVSELFQVSTDFLLKDETDIPASPSNDPLAEETTRCVTMEEANAYMDLAKKLSGRMALAVSLLIVSPVCLIQLGGIAEFGTGLTEDMAGGIGVAILLLLVAIAVAVLVLGGMQLSKYEYLEKEVFLLQHGVKDMVEQKRAAGENRYRAHIAAGVVLCIIGVVPLMLAAAFRAGDFVYVSCVNALLFFIACGVHLFVRSGLVYGSYQEAPPGRRLYPRKQRDQQTHCLFARGLLVHCHGSLSCYQLSYQPLGYLLDCLAGGGSLVRGHLRHRKRGGKDKKIEYGTQKRIRFTKSRMRFSSQYQRDRSVKRRIVRPPVKQHATA